MSPSRARYVTACQQLLALGVVVIALVPATRVVSLDVVGVRPAGPSGPTIAVPDSASWGPGHRWTPSIRVAERRDSVRERGALHRGDRVQASRVGAGHQHQRAR
jgi:hypothetical protein